MDVGTMRPERDLGDVTFVIGVDTDKGRGAFLGHDSIGWGVYLRVREREGSWRNKRNSRPVGCSCSCSWAPNTLTVCIVRENFWL
jgi:hypothetical protein